MSCTSILMLACFSLAIDPPPAETPKKSPTFSEKVQSALLSTVYFTTTYRVTPGLEYLPHLDSNPELKRFPDELLVELSCDDSERRQLAAAYVAGLAMQVLGVAWENRADEGEGLFRAALGSYANAIKNALEANLKKATGKETLVMAAALLPLTPDHAKAVAAVVAGLKDKDPGMRAGVCSLVAALRLSQEEMVAALCEALTDKEADVRRAAAQAAWKIGPKAAKTVPGLIELLKDGEAAYDEIGLNGVLGAVPRRCNVALLALAQMDAEARPAVSVLAKQLKGAEEEKQLALFACLAQLGPIAKDALPALRQPLGERKDKVRLHAAAAILCIDPTDRAAAEALVAALKSNDAPIRSAGLDACGTLSPKVEALIPLLTTHLQAKDEADRLHAVAALGGMGALAKPAVPALADLLTDPQFDFHTHHAAAAALAGVGSPSLSALIRVIRQKDSKGRDAAAYALGSMGKGAVDVLMEALEDDSSGVRAAAMVSLGRLKRDAVRAKEALTRLSREETDCVNRSLAAWALTQFQR